MRVRLNDQELSVERFETCYKLFKVSAEQQCHGSCPHLNAVAAHCAQHAAQQPDVKAEGDVIAVSAVDGVLPRLEEHVLLVPRADRCPYRRVIVALAFSCDNIGWPRKSVFRSAEARPFPPTSAALVSDQVRHQVSILQGPPSSGLSSLRAHFCSWAYSYGIKPNEAKRSQREHSPSSLLVLQYD